MKSILFASALFAVSSLAFCATGPTYQGPPLVASPQSVMAAKACAALPYDHHPNVNLTDGWSSDKTPVGMTERSCSNPYLPSVYCLTKASCPRSFTHGTNTPVGMRAQDVHWIVDVLAGSISVCAQYSNRFYVGSGKCGRKTCAATGGIPTRCVIPVESVGEAQPQSPTEVIIDADSDGVVIGAIGTAEVMN